MRLVPSALVVLGLGLAAPLAAVPPAAAAPTCGGAKATIVGNDRANTIIGTPRRDVIVAAGGNDTIRGRGGNDIICGGEGADRILGGPGDDRLHGELDGYRVDEYGRVLMKGDTLVGGMGDDLLDPGRDPRPPTPGAPGTSDGFSYADAPAAVVVDLRTNPATVTADGTDTLVTGGPLRFIGTDHSDTIAGTNYDDVILGRGGDDFISGNGGDDEIHGDLADVPGNDRLAGGGGDDRLVGLAGYDILSGNRGEDQLSTSSTLRSVVLGGAGSDTVTLPIPAEPDFVVRGHGGQDRLRLLAHPQPNLKPTVRLDQRSARTVIRQLMPVTVAGSISGFSDVFLPARSKVVYKGTNASEIITAHHDARALIYGRGGSDVMTGSRWADRLDGGKGFDIARGKGGRDTCKRAERRSSC